MEPITTSAMIGGIVTYLGTQLAKNKSIKEFISDFTGATVNWIRPLFLKDDGTEKEQIQQLKENPESEARKSAVESILKIALEDDPNKENFIKEIFEKISKTEEGGKIVNTITNSKNVNIGDINAGGDVHIGDG